MKILNCHAEINCVQEPFNPDHSGRGYLDRVQDLPTLRSVLAGIWARHDGIKHVWHPSGWPFGDDPSYNLHLLSQPGVAVLFLSRRNQLRRVLSFEIALQTNVWQRRAGASPPREQALMALSPAVLQDQLSLTQEGTRRCLQELAESGTVFSRLWYEEFFAPGQTLGSRVARLNDVLRFLGCGEFAVGQARDQVARLLDPAANRLADEAIYRRIPNIDEIEARCGSDESGRVFHG